MSPTQKQKDCSHPKERKQGPYTKTSPKEGTYTYYEIRCVRCGLYLRNEKK